MAMALAVDPQRVKNTPAKAMSSRMVISFITSFPVVYDWIQSTLHSHKELEKQLLYPLNVFSKLAFRTTKTQQKCKEYGHGQQTIHGVGVNVSNGSWALVLFSQISTLNYKIDSDNTGINGDSILIFLTSLISSPRCLLMLMKSLFYKNALSLLKPMEKLL